MPYENEHSARLKDPKDFDPKSFRRKNGGTIYGKIKVPKTIAIIWAKLKGKSKPKDPVIPQALRFPTKNWTVQKAKAWLKDNNVKYKKFEPAEKKKSKASYAKEKKYTCECIECGHTLETDKHCKDVKCPECGGQMRRKERPGPGQPAKNKEKQSMSENTAPLKACVFNESSEVMFEKDVTQKDNNKFRIIGYSGGIIKDHWFWGNVGIDLKGAGFHKERIPVLDSHFTFNRIGFTTKQEISDKVSVEGEFLDNDNAQAMKKDIQKGFPMEASVFCMPSVIEYVKEGASVEVNGHTLKGPGSVFRKSTIKEVSMCVFGADSNTESSAYADVDGQTVKFNLTQENNIMDEETRIESVESFAEQYPDLNVEILAKGKAEGMAEGQKAEHDSFAALQEACGDDHELVVQCFKEGKTAAEAMKLRLEKLEDEKTQLGEKVTELQKKKTVDPAVTEFKDQAASTGSEEKGKGDDEAWKQEFSASEDLQSEFGEVETYVAFKQADKAGKVRIAGRA